MVDWDKCKCLIWEVMDEISSKMIEVIDVCVFVIMCCGIGGGGLLCFIEFVL